MSGELSEDISATINCLRSLGAEIIEDSGGVTVHPVGGRTNHSAALDCAESGSTLRFMLPVAAVLGGSFTVTGRGRLPQRPVDTLAALLNSHGCTVTGNALPLRCDGKLTGGSFPLEGNVSSQYVSGLLFALPLLDTDSEIRLLSALESSAYADMTVNTLARFGVEVTKTAGGFYVKGNQTYRSPGAYEVEGDWSNTAFWLCAAAIGGKISCAGLNMRSSQPDREIVNILKRTGASALETSDGLTVTCGKLQPFDMDASQCPDLVPAAAVLMTAARGRSLIKNAGRLRLKESDRLSAVTSALNAVGANIRERADSLEIDGTGRLTGGTTDSFGDHRIAMALAVASLACESELTVTNAQAVTKSYPAFFEDFKLLGGKFDVV